MLTNFIWRFLERCGAQCVSFVVSLVLARLLAPEDYGVVALAAVFINLMQVFVDSGMANALIQKKDADELDFSSVFYFNVAVCLALYLLAFCAAPAVAAFYENPELTAIFRVLSLTIVISGVKNVQQAYVSRNLLFKRFFFATLGGTVGSAVIGIWMAWRGFGVWALVTQTLFNTAIDTLILWLTVRWRPRRMFSLRRLRRLFSFGGRLLVTSLLSTAYSNFRQLVIGKLYTAEDLAYYSKGGSFPNVFAQLVSGSLGSVLLPAMSPEQENRERLRDMVRRSIQTVSYITTPLLMGLAVCAEPVVRLLLTEKWLPCVPYVRIFCVLCAIAPIHSANVNAIEALGRADVMLKLNLIEMAAGVAVLLATMWGGPLWIGLGQIVNSLITLLLNARANRRLLGYAYGQQLHDILPAFALSAVMGLCVWPVGLLGLGDWATLAIQVPLGAAVYLLASKLCRVDSFTFLWDTLRQLLREQKAKRETETR